MIHDSREMERYFEEFYGLALAERISALLFTYVSQLLEAGAFTKLRGLILFTDGYGIFPVKMPPYDTVFCFHAEDYRDAGRTAPGDET